MTDPTTLVDDVCRVREALDTVAGALAEGRGDLLLATEAELAGALQSLVSAIPSSNSRAGITAPLRDEVARCRASLARCRRLGESLEHLVTHTLALEGRSGSYTRAGQTAIVPPSGTLQTRG